jgi:hypothetical protein
MIQMVSFFTVFPFPDVFVLYFVVTVYAVVAAIERERERETI